MQGAATVFSIKSGDTVELCSAQKAKNVAPQRMEVSLAGLQAPRLGVKTPTHCTPDEAFAWESREYLRTHLLNKQVQFKVHYEKGTQARKYAELRLDGKNIALDILNGGFAKLVQSQDTKKLPGFAEMEEAENSAKAANLGMHGPCEPRVLVNVGDSDFNLEQWVAKNKNKKRKAVVEWIRDGGCLRCCFLPEGEDNTYVTLPIMASGVQCPQMRRDGEKMVFGPFYEECKFWVESRFLCREVEVRVEALMKSQNVAQPWNIFGSIYHPKGSLSEFLLKDGFASYVDWSAKLTQDGDKYGGKFLRECQQGAQEKKLRRWKEFDGKGTEAGKEFNGKVVEVCSGDVVKVVSLDEPEKEEMRLYLSSVRAPGMPSRQREGEPWAKEAQEFMRKELVGKSIKVKPDYVKNIEVFQKKDANGNATGPPAGPPPSDKDGNLIFVTLCDEKGDNVVLKSIEKGLLTVQQHRDMDDRSRNYDDLLTAEEAAKAANIGIHSGSSPTTKKIAELCGAQDQATKKQQAMRAQSFEADLKKKVQDGVVQYCITGSRCRVVLPSHDILIAFKMNGVNAPNAPPMNPGAASGKGNGKGGPPAGEPFGAEALQAARAEILQQDVKLQFEGVDQAGVFRGKIFAMHGKKKVDLALTLLSKGLAYCDPNWCDVKEYLDVERTAKESKIGLWSLEQQDVVDASSNTQQGAISGSVGNINSVASFYLVDPKSENSIRVTEAIKNLQPASMESADDPRKGVMYLAQYWEDKQWYRAKNNGGRGGTYKMMFVDFGMETEVEKHCIKRIPAGNPLMSLPQTAIHCGLYGVKGSNDYWSDSCQVLFNCVGEKKVTANVEEYREGVHWVTLDGTGKSPQELLLKEGYARINKKQSNHSNLSAWEDAEKVARRARTNIWKWGEVDDSDEEYEK
jgi:staphylococcal nuclease domain-containing protein 1